MNKKLKSILYPFLTKIGSALVLLQPKKAHELIESGITLVHNDTSILERLMRMAILKKLEKAQNYHSIAELHQNYWIHKGAKFFSETEGAFEQDFLPNCTVIFDELEKILLNSPDQFHTLVEIGTGRGTVLNYLSTKFPNFKRCIGIDLSAAQVETNKKTYITNTKLEFFAEDIVYWIKQQGHSNTVFVTFGGVFEYFSEQQLKSFLGELNDLGDIIVVAIEPNDNNHNFELNPNSKLYGYEYSFSHNYPELFTNAGFNLWHLSKKQSNYGPHILTLVGAKN